MMASAAGGPVGGMALPSPPMSASTTSDPYRLQGLGLAAEFAAIAEGCLLPVARRMASRDLARTLEAYWRLGSPASERVIKTVLARGTELLSVCTPYQMTILLQVGARPKQGWEQSLP